MRLSRRTVLAAVPGLALSAPISAIAQEQTGATARELLRTGRYLPRWIELLDEPAERERVIASLGGEHPDAVRWILRDGITQHAAFLGEESIALRFAGVSISLPEVSDDLVGHDAVEAIVEAAKGHRVVMLNESHCASRHRAFLGRLLPALRDEGFTHLAAETFSEKASELQRGDAVTFEHGWYVGDPVYAEAVRSALALGYRLVPYEQRPDQRGDGHRLSDRATLIREQAQADNLRNALAADPRMRVLVFVGYSHLSEEGPQFGARFKADTGIDPLTIGQATTGAFGPRVEDAPPVRALLERLRPTGPVVLLKPGRRPHSVQSQADLSPEGTDLLVFHPAQPDVDGRPAWLAGDPMRRRLDVELPAGDGPRLLQALYLPEGEVIPADQFLVPDEAGVRTLFLRPGRYRLRLETAAGFVPLGEVEV